VAWLKTVLAELAGLFIDDAGFAVAILVWLGVAWGLLSRLGLPAPLPPALFVAGIVVVLVGSAALGAGKRPR
jgi:hypothetical protein